MFCKSIANNIIYCIRRHMIKNFKIELDEMRKNFVLHKNRIHLPEPPNWMDASDELADVYRLSHEIMSHGNVYYGNIIIANSRLHAKQTLKDRIESGSGSPASLIYSRDKIAEHNPFLIQHIASEILNAQENNNSVPKEFEEIIAILKDGQKRKAIHFSAEKEQERLNMEFVIMTVFRPFLPEGYVKCTLLPIIVSPHHPEHVIILPKQFWSKNFKRAWNEKRFY